jgi:Tfp pilus assembly PilM family ATPase
MRSWLCARRSAITFDVGAAGLRAYQLRQRGQDLVPCDALAFERTPTDPSGRTEPPTAPVVDAAQLSRLIGQGHFVGPDVALVLSPPDVQFLPIRLPAQALAQSAERIEQALKWEVAQESRHGAENLEVRHWTLPAGVGQSANVMAVVASSELVLRWCDLLEQQRLTLRRVDVSPCALVRLACCVWAPAEGDLWGVLDLGLRHSTLTVVIGRSPTYIRSLSVCAHHWTQKLAEAFEVPYATAEHLKREQSVQATDRGVRAAAEGGNLLQAADLSGAFSGVLRESLRVLAQETGRCFSYVMQGFPDTSVKHMFLAGGGAGLSGLPAVLGAELGIPVSLLATDGKTGRESLAAQRPDPFFGVALPPQAAAALGGAILDLEGEKGVGNLLPRSGPPGASHKTRRGGPPLFSPNLVPVIRLHTRRRARRGRAWLGVCTGISMLLATGWAAERTAATALGRLTDTVSALEVQRTEVQCRLVLADRQRGQLIEQLQTVVRARRPQSWPRRLVALAREAPAGVFLTGLHVDPPAASEKGVGSLLAPSGPEGASQKTRPGGATPLSPETPAPPAETRTVRLVGYALDHGVLLQFLHALQDSPDWRRVELIRATQEAYQSGLLVAFEMGCWTQEERP